MYASEPDPYCYPGTAVLKNRANLRDRAALEAFEHEAALQRAEEPYPSGRLTVSHCKAVHRHLFGDVYAWAGKFRTVRISKGESVFCYPENITAEMQRLFSSLRKDAYFRGMSADEFSRKAAHFLAELNAIHPFREGNGRTQLAFLVLLAEKAGYELNLAHLDAGEMLAAMIESFQGHECRLTTAIRRLIHSQ